MSTIRYWLENHAPGWLEGAYYFVHNRLTGVRCYAQGCGRLLLLHGPRRYRRCLDVPLGIVITDQALDRLVVAEAEQITRAATS